nr:pilus assembly protein [uncultured Enterobacter sp.]
MKTLFIKLLRVLRDRSGAIAVSVAIMMPVIVAFYSLAIDGARFNNSRSRLSDGLNQGVYAIALEDNRDSSSLAKNKEKVADYLSYYLPGETVDKSKVSVVIKEKSTDSGTVVDYQANADIIVHPIFKTKSLGSEGFSENVTIRGNGLSGSVRRLAVPISDPTDYVFVLDFSGSMEEASADIKMSRMRLLKNAVEEIGKTIFDNDDGSTIGFVPYSLGTPSKLDKTNYSGPRGKEIGCSYIAKLKSDYSGLDMNYWYNKPSLFQSYTWDGYKVRTVPDKNTFVETTDKYLYQYYEKVIAHSNNKINKGKTLDADNWLIEEGMCRKVANDSQLKCDADPLSDVHNPANDDEWTQHKDAFFALAASENYHYSIANIDTIDYSATLAGDFLFKEENVVTFINFLNEKDDYNSGQGDGVIPFTMACYESINSHTNVSVGERIQDITQPNFYTLDLTDDRAVLDEFDAMGPPNGGTDSINAMLRATPLLAKGKNKRKMMFVISDGEDSGDVGSAYRSAWGPVALKKKMMETYKVCDVIRDGLMKYSQGPETISADIFYISLVKNNTVGDWANSCTGKENAYVATSLDELIDILKKAMFKSTIEYVNPNEKSK